MAVEGKGVVTFERGKLFVKRKIFSLFLAIRQQMARSGWGVIPDFIIVGAQRCGTSSLYEYLTGHPHILPALRKEVHYFDINFDKGVNWYQSFLPLTSFSIRRAMKSSKGQSYLTGEATPYYLFHPHAARRIAETTPHSKLIFLLRNPVDRAYSHFLHATRRGHESLPFEEAIAREEERIGLEEAKMLQDKSYESFDHQWFSYLHRGIYYQQIERYLSYFGKEQILVILSEEFFESPGNILEQALAFLGVHDVRWKPQIFPREQFYGPYSPIKPATRRDLIDYFKPYNQRLANLLGLKLDWDR